MLKLNDATMAHISQIKVLKITEILAQEKNHVEIDKCMLEMKDDKLLNCAFVIINMIVEAGMEMRFGGDSCFFVFLGSKSKFPLS